MKHWPVPTTRAVILAAIGLLPALLAVAFEPLAWVSIVFDVVLLGLMLIDANSAPRSAEIKAERLIDEVISSGVQHVVRRHMAGEVQGRRKLDYAVDAALRLAKVSLDRGDEAGVMAFAGSVQQWLPPRTGAEQPRAIARALYRVEAVLEESDANRAIDLAFSRGVRRSLVVLLTDLGGSETSASIFKRTLRLVPRHLPLIVSMRDDALHQAATSVPETRQQALERLVASRLEKQSNATVARLREAGARVLRASPATFGAATVNEYLNIKSRGLL